MEHPCHQCGAPVEDGVSFCPQCNAPQIRVQMALAEPGAPAMPPVRVALPGQLTFPFALQAAAIAGGGAALLSIFTAPLVRSAFVLWMVAGGAFAVALYRRRQPLADITSAMGARLGAISGLLGFVVFAAIETTLMLTGPGEEMRQAMREAIQHAAAQNPDPQVQQMVQRLLTPEGMAAVLILVMALMLVVFVIFGLIGGALWASLGRRDRV